MFLSNLLAFGAMMKSQLAKLNIGMSRSEVCLKPHDKNWAKAFQFVSDELKKVLTGIAFHHVGSTAISGISAKPILDILGISSSLANFDSQKSQLETLGFVCKGEYGIPGRRYNVLYDQSENIGLVHLHIFEESNDEVEKHLVFRDFVRADMESAARYQELKLSLAKSHLSQREKYTEGKSQLISAILQKAKVWRATIFQKLVSEILDQGIEIKVVTQHEFKNGEKGSFDLPRTGVAPSIRILRGGAGGYWVSRKKEDLGGQDRLIRDSVLPSVDMATLAHEFGHFESYKKELRSQGYEDALKIFEAGEISNMELVQKELIIAEEQRAWDFGRNALSLSGFNDWDSFEMEKARGISIYREKLGLQQL